MDDKGRLVPSSVEVNVMGSTYLKSLLTDTVCLGYGDEKNLGDHCKIQERPKSCDRSDQKGAMLMGPATRLAWTNRSCGCNAHNGMCHRHGVVRPEPTKSFEYAFRFLAETKPGVSAEYEEHFLAHGSEWIKRWPLSKQQAIIRSRELDELAPGLVKNMVKREHGSTKASKARCIQFYTNLATQAEFGAEFASVQKAYGKDWVRREIDGRIRVTIGTMMNSVKLGEWLGGVLRDYRKPMFYERDGKAWDSTMGKMHHDLKMEAYSFMPPDFKKFANDCYSVKGTGVYRDGSRLVYTVEGTTKSGHNDTTIGNCIINAMIAAEACHRQGLAADIIVVGDDLLIIIEGDFDAAALAAEEAALGIVPEYRKFDDIEDVSFISGQWIPVSTERYIFAPKLGRLLARLHWTVTPPSPKHHAAYLRGVYSGIRATCHSIPVMSALAPAVKGETRGVDRWYTEMYGEQVAEYTRADVMPWFLRKYRCSEEEVETLEAELADRTPRIIRSDLIDRIEEVDLADIQERVCVRF